MARRNLINISREFLIWAQINCSKKFDLNEGRLSAYTHFYKQYATLRFAIDEVVFKIYQESANESDNSKMFIDLVSKINDKKDILSGDVPTAFSNTRLAASLCVNQLN